jgi:hypothetical protein
VTIHSDSDLLKKIAGSSGPNEDQLALDFAERHCAALRYVDIWGKWLFLDGKKWCRENTLAAFDLVRKNCRDTQ